MTLAGMLKADRDALLCDLAETYGIYDLRAVPVPTLAMLAAGLRDNSRIKTRLSGGRPPRSDLLLAAAVDRLSWLVWGMSEDAKRGANRPKSILATLLGEEEKSSDDISTFETAEDFNAAWAKITGVSYG